MVLLQVSGDLEGIGRMLACYASATRARARSGRAPVLPSPGAAPRRRRSPRAGG
jgi:hypothetical protein